MIKKRAMAQFLKCCAHVLYRDSESATTQLRRLQCIQFELGQRGYEGTSGRKCGQAPKAIRRQMRYLEEVHDRFLTLRRFLAAPIVGGDRRLSLELPIDAKNQYMRTPVSS